MTQSNRPAPGRPAPRHPAAQVPSRRATIGRIQLPGDWKLLLIAAVVLIVLGLALQLLWPDGFPLEHKSDELNAMVAEIYSSGAVRINELMASNSATLMDENGLSSDWIEICNVSGAPVDLSGYSLGKSERSSNVFTFPEHVLGAGECVVVFADSILQNSPGSQYHAPFRLSSQGGSLMLFSNSGTAVDSVNFPAMASDSSYVREDVTVWKVSDHPTPGLSNTEESYQLLRTPNSDTGILITEVVTENTQYAPDENGVCHDYFELYNSGSQAADLSGWFVGDSVDKPAGWRLPEGFVLQPGEYRIVYASGMNRADVQYPHTDFGLSSEGEAVVISDKTGRIVDKVEFGLIKGDVALLRQDDGSWIEGTPTPGS